MKTVTITSRDNHFAKQLIALAHSSRERKKAKLTVLDGIHLARAYVDALGPVQSLAIAESVRSQPEVAALIARHHDHAIHFLSDALMAQSSSLDSPAGVLAVVSTPAPVPTPLNASAVLLLEDIQDPGNVGSLLRSAAAAGVREVILSKTSAFAWSPKVLRAGQGAHFVLNIVEGVDVLDWILRYEGQSLAMVPHSNKSQVLYEYNLSMPTAILIGNEGSGLSKALIEASTARVTIPMPGQMESLNAAACGAIALFEMVRQRLAT